MKKLKTLNGTTILNIGRLGSILSILMYTSYIPEIIDNLQGNYSDDEIQPLFAALNCLIWVIYAAVKKKTDWPLLIACVPGVIFGIAAFVTGIH